MLAVQASGKIKSIYIYADPDSNRAREIEFSLFDCGGMLNKGVSFVKISYIFATQDEVCT